MRLHERASAPALDPCDVLIAEDQALFREAVLSVLDGEPDMRVVADVGDGRDVFAEVLRTRPNVALVNASLPGCDPVRLTRRITEGSKDCRVILLVDREDPTFLVEVLKAGARGCVTKETQLVDFLESIRAVRDGHLLVPPEMLPELVERLISQAAARDQALRRVSHLTPRERHVLALLSEGGNNGSVARELFISPHTARTHIQNVISKLGVHSRLEAAMFVAQTGILDELLTTEY
jgi:DNA-binding NarL/FixJ family response regulator